MAKSIIEPLLREHAHIRTLMGELRAHTERFDLPGMRTTSQKMIDVIRPHILKEESILYLIGMKSLQFFLIPEVHHQNIIWDFHHVAFVKDFVDNS